MPTRAQVSAWIAAWGIMLPTLGEAQGRADHEIIELIVRDGPQATAIRASPEVTRREQLARLSYPNPSVAYSREGAGFTEFLQVEQVFPFFGTRAALARAGVAATAAAEAERDARLWQLRAHAASAVARLLAEQERVDAAQSTVREVERLIDLLRVREREGEGSRFDRVRAEHELEDARQAAVAAAVSVVDARAALAALLPRDVSLTRIIGVLYREHDAPALEALVTRSAASRAELRALRFVAERATVEADAARRARKPAPSFMGGFKRADEEGGRARGGVFGLTLAVPLFDTGGRDVARWTAERIRTEAERASLEQEIRAQIAGATEALALRRQALAGSGTATPLPDDLTAIAEVAYREGEVGILELLDAVRVSARGRARNIDRRLDARLAQIALERATGDVLWP